MNKLSYLCYSWKSRFLYHQFRPSMGPHLFSCCLPCILLPVHSRYLAHDMEEDEEESKLRMLRCALGRFYWKSQLPTILYQREQLWDRMDFRAMVSREECEEVRHLILVFAQQL